MIDLTHEEKIEILSIAKSAVINASAPLSSDGKSTVEQIEAAYRKFEALITGEGKTKKG